MSFPSQHAASQFDLEPPIDCHVYQLKWSCLSLQLWDITSHFSAVLCWPLQKKTFYHVFIHTGLVTENVERHNPLLGLLTRADTAWSFHNARSQISWRKTLNRDKMRNSSVGSSDQMKSDRFWQSPAFLQLVTLFRVRTMFLEIIWHYNYNEVFMVNIVKHNWSVSFITLHLYCRGTWGKQKFIAIQIIEIIF